MGWKFRSYSDELAIKVRFNEIAKKFSEIYPIGVTILVPSTNELNTDIAKTVMSYSKDAELLEGVLCKLTTTEVKKSFCMMMIANFEKSMIKISI